MILSLDNSTPMSLSEELAREKLIFQGLTIAKGTAAEAAITHKILARDASSFEDRFYNNPQIIFLIYRQNAPTIVGRKILSRLFLQKKTAGLFCSLISAPMLLGFLKSHRALGDSIQVDYYPFTDGEKLTVFNEIKKDRHSDIYFPYQYKAPGTGLERVWPPENWSFTPDKLESLNLGERHLRSASVAFLKRSLKGHEKVYDPACSTGFFLHEIKNAFPGITTIGHDSSPEMLEYARTRVDECACCDAAHSPLSDESIDVLFLRFLNQNVVTKTDACSLLSPLLRKVRKNGWVFCFGHTPVLVPKELLESEGLELIELNGYDDQTDCIFQFYAMRRN